MEAIALQRITPQEFQRLLSLHTTFVASQGKSGEQLDFSEREFVDCDFSGQTLHEIAGARGASFVRCNFSRSDCYGVNFAHSTFADCNFTGAQLNKCEFWDATIHNTRFDDAVLRDAEFSKANINGGRFTRANLRGAVLADSVLSQCVFDGADLSGAAISDNKETGVSWTNAIGIIKRAAAAAAVTTLGALSMEKSRAEAEARAEAQQTTIDGLFFSVVDQLLATPLSDVAAVAKTMNIAALKPGSDTAHFQSFFSGEQRPVHVGLAFTKVELRQSKTDTKKAILIGEVAEASCITRAAVLKRFPAPKMVPPSPQSRDSQGYLSVSLQGARVSFGFKQDRADCVASVVIDRIDPV